ncbi:MAG: hypothetical protein LBU87_02015 [Lactobacillales bacterium]|jgi:hypothetical protein|nr:hypothetical protein [Lactobacillales bacterium]
MVRKSLFSLAVLFLSACGFTPLYLATDGSNIADKSPYVNITPMQNYDGYKISGHLRDKLNPEKKHVTPLYDLSVKVDSIRYTDQSIQDNNFMTRQKTDMVVSYQMKDRSTGKTLINAKTHAVGSYNITNNPYANTVEQQKDLENLYKTVADNISTHVMTYLKSQEEPLES